jgi:hypothetical protein
MRILTFVVALSMLTAFQSKGQQLSFSIKESKQGEDLYLQGTKLVEIGKFNEADSVLTLALCTYKNEDVYYNRAISRLYRTDTTGFCEDMSIASNKYYDPGARQLFNKLCCYKVDSIFYDKKYLVTNSSNYKYLEEIQCIKKDGDKIGTIHERDRKMPLQSLEFGCENLLGMRTLTTDIIACYKLTDSTRNYFRTTDVPVMEKVTQLKELKEKLRSYFTVKYKALKDQSNLGHISIYYEFTVTNKGEIIDGKYGGISPLVSITGYETELEKDVQDALRKYPKLKPAKFRGENVNFMAYDYIDF